VTASQQPQPRAAAGPPSSPASAEPSIGQLVSQASEQLSTLVRSELELAKLELRSSVKNAGVGFGMFAAAGAVLVFALTFGFFALAEGLAAAGLYRWVAFLVVFGLLLLLVGLLVLIGVRKVKRIKAPERTITTSRETVAYLREHAPRG
jgi:uncharacterized membrane protein YqjE